ncbi:MAG: hypothetical protein U9N11_03755 [Campylobacterota bacterium]|nr:hypothetical protein [Campylobacterota bacterium]
MQLSDIVEKYSLKTMSETTNISENNLEYMIAEDFSSLTRPKALGFISIIEREYDVDLKPLKKTAIAYYETHESAASSVSIGLPLEDKKKGNSKWFFFFIFALLAYASWYFFSQFSQNTLGNMLSLNESNVSTKLHVDSNEQNTTTNTQNEPEENDGLSIKSVLASVGIESNNDVTEEERVAIANAQISESDNVIVIGSSNEEYTEVNSTDKNTSSVVMSDTNKTTVVADTKIEATVTPTPKAIVTPTPEVVSAKKSQKVVLKPKTRLWFGMVNMSNKKRDHFSISDTYEIDVSDNKRWLIATSAAEFTLTHNEETKNYNSGKENYFKVTEDGITPLSKGEYVKQGGWKKW